MLQMDGGMAPTWVPATYWILESSHIQPGDSIDVELCPKALEWAMCSQVGAGR